MQTVMPLYNGSDVFFIMLTPPSVCMDHKCIAIRFGKNPFESVCLDILEQGCHRAFQELFNINEQQKADREAAGKDSGFYYDPMIIDSEEKLQQLKTFLIAAEIGQRRGMYECL